MESVLRGREVPESSKLHGAHNYSLWAFKLKTIFQGEKTWIVVDPDHREHLEHHLLALKNRLRHNHLVFIN
jgi:hypothetical protein